MEVNLEEDVESNPESSTGSDSEGDLDNNNVSEADSDPGSGSVQTYIILRTKLNSE